MYHSHYIISVYFFNNRPPDLRSLQTGAGLGKIKFDSGVIESFPKPLFYNNIFASQCRKSYISNL